METRETLRVGAVIALCQAQVTLCAGHVVVQLLGIRAACQECSPASIFLPIGAALFFIAALAGFLRREIPPWAWKLLAFAGGFQILLTISAFARGYRCLFCTISASLTLVALLCIGPRLDGRRVRTAIALGVLVGAGASLAVLQ